jgi:hypothetical protein
LIVYHWKISKRVDPTIHWHRENNGWMVIVLDLTYPEWNISRIDLDDEDGQKQFADYNRLCIDKGFEGIMIKPVTGVYECKRSSPYG